MKLDRCDSSDKNIDTERVEVRGHPKAQCLKENEISETPPLLPLKKVTVFLSHICKLLLPV